MDVADLFRRASSRDHRGGGSNSLSGFISTLIPVLLVATIIFIVFLVFQNKLARVYRPRTLDTFVSRHDRTPQSKPGMFGWVANYRALPDTFVLNHNSLDNYLFLRFFKLMIVICFIGCCITWPVLFPVNITGHGGQKQLDRVSFSNTNPSFRYFAHAAVAWVFLGFVVAAVTRERIFFIGLRQAYYLSSFHAQRISSRTVLFLGVPKQHLEPTALRQIFGPAVRKIHMVSDCNDLEDKVKNRDKIFNKLEAAQITLITNTVKQHKKGKLHEDSSKEGPARYVSSDKANPDMRLKPIIGKKVNCRKEGPRLADEVEHEQYSFLDGAGKKATACFIEFQTQESAQRAYQLTAQKSLTEFHPRYIGVHPDEVVWKNLGTSMAARKSKNLIATCFICILIIFWAIPVAIVGAISNINYLTNEVHFLSFINKIPPVILGVVTGLLPVVALAVLMSLVPIICRLLAKTAGEPTLSRIELKTQGWYFAFQVIQVFLVTTFASGAASVVSQIVQQPKTAVSLLAKSLPKASNFYIDYFVLYGLNAAAMQVINLVPFVMLTIVGKFLDKTPRKQYTRWITLGGLGWGSTYPLFTNLGVIALTYSIIAPLVLGFATLGLSLLYLGFRYNMLFTLGNKVDTKGESYARALQHLLWGVYLSSMCLIGLFAIGTAKSKGAIGPLAMMVIFLIAVIVFQFMVNKALGPLEQNIPLDLLRENEKSVNLYSAMENGGDAHMHAEKVDNTGQLDDPTVQNGHGQGNWQAPPDTPANAKAKPNFLTKMAKPMIYKSYQKTIALLAKTEAAETMPEYNFEEQRDAFENPAITSKRPLIWLAKDHLGLSKSFAEENQRKGVATSDEGAWYDDKGKVMFDRDNVERMPIWDGRRNY